MKKLNSNSEIIELINSSQMSIVYFTGTTCGACVAIKQKVELLMKKFPKIECGEISGEEHLDIAAEYGVFHLPIFILYVDKKETLRLGRNLSMLDLERDIERYYKLIYD